MAIKTYTERYEENQAAITAIEAGAQSYEIAGRKQTKANLADLYAQNRYLYPLALRESRGRSGSRVRGITPVDI